MTLTKTHDVPATTAQIAALASAGCEVVRVAVPKLEDANALARIVAFSPIPVIADIHFNASLALKAIEAGVQWLTLYAFSSENWLRPAEEVKALTGLMRFYLRAEVATLAKEGIRLQVIGERERFGAETMREIERAEAQTAAGRRLTLTVCLSYGARSEIAAAARAMAQAVQDGRLDPASIDETSLGRFLYTAAMPDPDLIIRTSGEQRLSNFLLWQAAYAEFVFQDVLWPDYGQPHLAEALREYGRRERRYGARTG